MKVLRRSSTSTSNRSSSSPALSWIHLRSLLVFASSPVADRGILRSPWAMRRKKRALSRRYWNGLFTADGKLRDCGVKFLKRARSMGVDPSIRADVWPFLLGVYDLNSTALERNAVRVQKRKEYENLRRQCRLLSSHCCHGNTLFTLDRIYSEVCRNLNEDPYSPKSFEEDSAKFSLFMERNGCESRPVYDRTPDSGSCYSDREDEEDYSEIIHFDAFLAETGYSNSHREVLGSIAVLDPKLTACASLRTRASNRTVEDFATWQRIIRLDAIRADTDWVMHSPNRTSISVEVARRQARAVGLKDYDHLDPCVTYHAARLVALLEAYAIYDPEIGYCQGMSDLLSPILAVMSNDYEAFWCFVGFMRKARHNFRLDEFGIRRQLAVVSRIIQCRDSHLYRHLEKLQAEDCYFVYRMVVVLFRRELTFEQTTSLWEVMWADQAAIREGLGRFAWGKTRLRAPPTDDLLLYAIAASVLQRRKLIIERYKSLDEIIKECNNMAGQLDVWRLLDDAHDLVVALHGKI